MNSPIFYFPLIWIAALVVHELGHLIYFKKLGKIVELRYRLDWNCIIVGHDKDYENIEKAELRNLYLAGILPGLFVVTIYSFVESFYVLVIPLYLFACKSDIINYIKA